MATRYTEASFLQNEADKAETFVAQALIVFEDDGSGYRRISSQIHPDYHIDVPMQGTALEYERAVLQAKRRMEAHDDSLTAGYPMFRTNEAGLREIRCHECYGLGKRSRNGVTWAGCDRCSGTGYYRG